MTLPKPLRKFNPGIFLLAFGAFFVFAISILMVRLGYFQKMDVHEVDMPQQLVIYRPNFGAYHKVMPVFTEVEAKAKELGIPCPRTFGLYLDNPEKTEEARLRSEIGCIVGQEIAPEALDKAIAITKDSPNATILAGQIPAGKYLQILFDGSPAIGPQKIYPYAKGYFRDKGWGEYSQVYEIYLIGPGEHITTEYLFPIP